MNHETFISFHLQSFLIITWALKIFFIKFLDAVAELILDIFPIFSWFFIFLDISNKTFKSACFLVSWANIFIYLQSIRCLISRILHQIDNRLWQMNLVILVICIHFIHYFNIICIWRNVYIWPSTCQSFDISGFVFFIKFLNLLILFKTYQWLGILSKTYVLKFDFVDLRVIFVTFLINTVVKILHLTKFICNFEFLRFKVFLLELLFPKFNLGKRLFHYTCILLVLIINFLKINWYFFHVN